ncbi:MAG TPA: hypothetical protein VFI94_14370, partial [Pseudolabrys sp.]|nr:hypothetical protein [Pseudolabrys sp.]
EEGEGVKTINETVDSSVFARWRADPNYRPPNLSNWAKSQNVDPSKIMTSVRADDASIVVDP